MALEAIDEDGNRAEVLTTEAFDPAEKAEAARQGLRKQLCKAGETVFDVREVLLEIHPAPFVPVAALNALRRELYERLAASREMNRPRTEGGALRNDVPYPEKELSYLGNVLNRKAEAFYRRHGVERIEPAAESGLDLRGRKVMTTRYCLKHQLGLCARYGGQSGHEEPFALVDAEGHRLELRFNCRACEMEVWFEK